MRSSILLKLTCLVIGIIPVAHAQVVLQFSNLGATSSGSLPVATNHWAGASFSTSSTADLELGSVTLAMLAGTSDSSDFQVMLYSATYGGYPTTQLATFTGNADPSEAGNYTYTSTTSVVLEANTNYWIVAHVGSGTSTYQWAYTDDTPATGPNGWQVGPVAEFADVMSVRASDWNGLYAKTPIFSISTGVVPEPATFATLAGVAVLGCAVWSRRKRLQRPL